MTKFWWPSSEGKVTVQVIPFNVGAHAAQDSNFVLFDFESDANQSPVVFVEGLTFNYQYYSARKQT